MARILLTWELGGGLGHLFRLRSVGCELMRRGHSVLAAVRSLARAKSIFAESGIPLVAAPIKLPSGENRIDQPFSYAQLLHNIGFGDEPTLRTLIESWRKLLTQFQPDVVLCDHSPTALLALRGQKIPVLTIGTGFCSPPAGEHLPLLRPCSENIVQELLQHETQMLQRINRILKCGQINPLDRLPDLFNKVEASLLTTFAELDHFGPRLSTSYWGTMPSGSEALAVFPLHTAPNIFAYLKMFPGMLELLAVIQETGLTTLVVGDGFTNETRRKFTSANISWAEGPVDLEAAANLCDFAVTNAGHGVMATMLLAGKPLLLAPMYLEQLLGAECVSRMGAGLIINSHHPLTFASALASIIYEPSYRQAAHAFAARHSEHCPAKVTSLVADYVKSIVAN